MNSSIYGLDRTTHFKIVAVAALTAAIFLVVGKSARLDPARPPVSTPATFQMPGPAQIAPAATAVIAPHAVG